jgi:hypothetical protein
MPKAPSPCLNGFKRHQAHFAVVSPVPTRHHHRARKGRLVPVRGPPSQRRGACPELGIDGPPMKHERVQNNAYIQVVLKPKARWRDGTSHLIT